MARTNKYKRVPRSPRRNGLPVQLVAGAFLRRHEHLAGAFVALRASATTASSPKRILQHAPAPFERVQGMSTVGRSQMARQATCGVGQCGGEWPRPLAPAPIDDHPDLFAGIAKDAQDLMAIVAPCVCGKMWHDRLEEAPGALLDGPQDAAQEAAGEAALRAIVPPGLAFERFVPFDVTRAQWTAGKTGALSPTPPASLGQGTAPEDGFIFIQ
jgi:hypothetical protein